MNPCKVYLAARYSRRPELLAIREALVAAGHTVTSRWLDGNYPVRPDGKSAEAPTRERARVAAEDMTDVLAADVVVSFTEPPRSDGRGGRHVEFGIALAAAKLLVVVGPREHVFHCLVSVVWYPDFAAFADAWQIPDVTEGGRKFGPVTYRGD